MILPSGNSTIDYSKNAEARGWGKGWPTCNAGPGRIVTATRSGTTWVGIHIRIAPLFSILVNECEQRGWRFHPGWNWGGSCRPIAGTNTPSNHSWLLAADLDAPDNPYTSTGQHTLPDWLYALFRAYGFGVGADYTGGKKDWMHVEFMGTPDDADKMLLLAQRAFLNIAIGVPNTPQGYLGDDGSWPLLPGHYFGQNNSGNEHNGTGANPNEKKYVAEFQNQLKAFGYLSTAPDGIYGPKTAAATSAWQLRNPGGVYKIINSALCGSNDWAAIHADGYHIRAEAPAGKEYPLPQNYYYGWLTGPRESISGMANEPGAWKQGLKDAQNQLIARGYALPQWGADGKYGKTASGETHDAILRFQRDHGLFADGKLGRDTWRALFG